ncbi:SDR family NAD(P)-dependent oxidoreductase [Embleya scabrispora]|uniref:SDR family NAD(P)-dependent oxidoreductase n=1 Tax=Embleya scabrispora TaxID=159449 RepID=UPI000364C25E|nr:SDR family oxidoreductase [Embleya scabrispora]MYS85860.1 SDR family oxidoreductase [Streptomyces sp. SID5474]
MLLDPSAALLTDRIAVVTGAARGIGAATAVALARFGADVAICDREPIGLQETAKAIEASGRRTLAVELDVRDGDGVERFLHEAHSTLGGLDILVNNAGGGFWSPFMEVRPKGQTALVDENFTSVTHVIRHGAPLMREGGSIVNVTSIEAFRAAPGFAVYAAMKAAVEQLTKSLALELSDRRIRVNCVAPDAIPTPGDAGLAETFETDEGAYDYAAKVPLGLGTPDDCAAPIVFLAGDLARFVTGTTLHVDGGTMAASGWVRRPDGTFTP